MPIILFQWSRWLLAVGLLLVACFTSAHPQDDVIISDIEMGPLQFQSTLAEAEYQAALKRQQQRKRNAMPWQQKFLLYTKAGVEHIIPKGLDHILFVLGLFFSTLALASLLWQVSAFTLAHSLTLVMAALGVVSVPANIIEPLIALSIVWVAIENCVFKQSTRWRPIVVFAFGLLHGLGFASVLSEYGLPKNDFLVSLLAFNIGVEIGQIAILLGAAILVWLIKNKSWYRFAIQIPASVFIATVGVYWFAERTVL
ncbi:HupE/UreJ family protein [Marinibactrum halimedae]|uniref:HupE/UreJ family protein n=1 Tax=Marinibactrum halimedae TaxID=1444977 RepID=A0AA37TAH0_9GAMM|nr:HupE/UreJ family protein [Marinibactrum halimedae]MCD9460539.1 HupE/UreJ family protein [Marinibactrum halimedae]GLS27902.1 hypothetical protein GCM10007877_36210 [Marinibactrum halimedae]